MDELKKLYDILTREGKYTKSFEEFQTQWGEQSYKQKVFEVVSRDGLYTKDKDSFFQKYSGQSTPAAPTEELKKKGQSVTTASPSADTSLALPTEPNKEEDGAVTKFFKGAGSLLLSPVKSILEFTDNAVNASKNVLKGEGFFDDEVPDTPTPISDAINKRLQQAKESKTKGSSPLDVRQGLANVANLIGKVINSSMPDDTKKTVVNKLQQVSNGLKGSTYYIDYLQEKHLADNVPTNVVKGMLEFAPDLALAALAENPGIAESKFAKLTEKATEKSIPIVKKYAPKAAKIFEEGLKSPIAKIMAVKGAVQGMAETKEGENLYLNAINGSIEGAGEGVYMHGLGVAAGKVTNPIARQISKLGINSAIATAITTPLANAGVFTTARALRTGITEGRMITAEEAAMEAGTGIGFSLLHLGSQYKNQKEANFYYDNILNDNAADGLGRVINETKTNLDLAYDPTLTPEKVYELEEARDELKEAILKEPDMAIKKQLGDEAVKIQNQLDAHNHIQNIVENKDALIDEINANEHLDDKQKEFYTNKISAIADTYDMSEFAVKKRELDAKINKAQDELNAAGEVFTNLKSPSDRAKAKLDVDNKRKELEDLNNELTQLIKDKTEKDAIQEQATDESVLRTEQPELELPKVVEGNIQPEVVTEQETITPEGEKEIGTYEYEGKKYSIDKDGVVTDIERDSMVPIDLSDKVKSEGKLIEPTPEGTQEIKVGEIEKDANGEFVPKKYTLNAIGENPAPEIPLSAIDPRSFGEEQLPKEAKGVKLLEIRGRNSEGKLTGKVLIKNEDGGQYDAEVFFNDAELKPLEEKQPAPETKEEVTIEEKPVESDVYYRSGKMKEDYIKQQLSKALNEMSFKKFADLYRKHFDKYFTRENNLKSNGGKIGKGDTFKDLSRYIIADEYYGYPDSEAKFRAFAKDAGIEIPENKIVTEKPASPEAKSLADKIRAAKVGKGKAFDAILGIPVAIWDGSVELVAKTVEAGKSLKDAIKAGIKYIEANHKGKFDAKEYEREIKAGFIDGYEDTMKKMQDDIDIALGRKDTWENRVKELTDKLDAYKETDEYKEGDKRGKADKLKKAIEEAKQERDTSYESTINDAMEILKGSEMYKNASDIEKEELVRDVRERFELKEKKAPSPEKLLGQKKPENISMTMKDFMNKVAKAAKEGSKSVEERIKDAKKKIQDYFESVKDYGNLTRADQVKIRKEMMKVEDEKSLDKAVDKINDIIDNAKTDIIEMSEYKMLREMLLVAKEVKDNIEERRKVIKAAIDNITKAGKVSAKQAGKLLNMINKVNLDSDVQVEKVIEYAEKIFNDAEYTDKLDKANGLKADLAKLSKSKGKNIHLKMMAKAFSQIKPSMVEDIDAYNDMAAKIKEAVAGSRIVGGEDLIKLAKMVNIDDVNAFIEESMKYQRQRMLDDKIAEAEEILGKDVSGMSYDDIVKLINEATEKNEPVDKDKKTIIKEAIKKLFADSSNTIKDIFSTGKNPITGEDLDISDSKKDLVNRFMNMNLDLLEAKQSLNAVDALNNFIENGSTAGMEAVVRQYQGKENAIEGKKLSESKGRDKLQAHPLKLYWSKGIGRFFGQQISTMPNLLERMFKGESKGAKFSKISGITELKNKKTYVQAKVNQIANDFTSEFYKRKANGNDFNSQENIIERGMIADLKRNVIGTEEEQQIEFNRNKGILEQSIDALKNGTEKERAEGDLYKKVYDKIVDGSKNIDDVVSKSDKNNVEAVDWWTEKWDDIYDELADVSENVYNEVLDRDINFNPRKFSRLAEAGDAPELASGESLFHRNNNGVYKKKTGVLEKAVRPDSLPKNSKEEPLMYRDLSFDKNNINSMYDALMDIHTSGVVRQVESFFKSKEIKSIIPSLEDRALLFNESGTGRVQEFVRALRNKQIVNSDEITKLARALNTTAGIGVSAALGGVSQPLKQVFPVMFNTLMNAGNVKMGYMFNEAQRNFLDKIGYGISIRGVESQSNIESINKIMTLASRSTPKKALELIEKANKMWLKAFLEAPDVYIARASWLSYYEKALKKQGKDPSTIDYNKHEVNEDAADYAQRMVDRQQNISDKDLQGKFFSSKDTFKQIVSKIAMPFANFRLNQSMRMMSDISTITSKTASAEDKLTAAKSLGGFSIEMAAFKGIAYGMSLFLGSVTKALMGQDETDEEYQKRKDNSFKAQLTGATSDLFSPLPMLDYPVVKGVDFIGDLIQDFAWVEEEDKSHLYTNYKTDIPKSLGVFGIGLGKAENLAEIIKLSATGRFKDEYGRDKYISEDDREALKVIGAISLISNFGLAPAEVNTIAKNAVKYAEKNASTKTPEEVRGKSLMLHGYDNAKEMKRYDPDLYDKTFGKDSPLYESEKKFKELKKEQRQKEIEAEDLRRGYQPKRKSWFKKREKGSWFKKRKSE